MKWRLTVSPVEKLTPGMADYIAAYIENGEESGAFSYNGIGVIWSISSPILNKKKAEIGALIRMGILEGEID